MILSLKDSLVSTTSTEYSQHKHKESKMSVYEITIDTDSDPRELRALLGEFGEVIQITQWDEDDETL
jgi:hypothetical protein